MYPEERASLGMMSNVYNNVPNNSRRVCPVCKSSCSVPTLVPIYVRSTNEPSPVNRNSFPNNGKRSIAGKVEESRQEENTNHLDDVVRPGNNGDHQPQENEVLVEAVQETSASMPLSATDDFSNNDSFGLRQRRQGRLEGMRNDSEQHRQPIDQQQVPNRPAASSPQHRASRSSSGNSSNIIPNANYHANNNNNNNWMSPMSPNGRTHGSLTHGILMSFQQAAIQANNGETDANGRNHGHEIPSIHNIRDGSFDHGLPNSQQQHYIDVNAETTQYLSRLLIMLTSFVILCLLLL
jgi:hypothetical protein